jgi:hypothetical protein
LAAALGATQVIIRTVPRGADSEDHSAEQEPSDGTLMRRNRK